MNGDSKPLMLRFFLLSTYEIQESIGSGGTTKYNCFSGRLRTIHRRKKSIRARRNIVCHAAQPLPLPKIIKKMRGKCSNSYATHFLELITFFLHLDTVDDKSSPEKSVLCNECQVGFDSIYHYQCSHFCSLKFLLGKNSA